MSDQQIPEEELSYSSFDVADITKTVNAAQANVIGAEDVISSTNQDNTDTTEKVEVITPEDISAQTNDVSTETTDEQLSDEPFSYTDNEYAAAMQLVRENGLLNIPEEMEAEMTPELWQELLNTNEYQREQRTLNSIRENASDPKIAELLDYVMNDGGWYGYDDMKNAIQEEIDISSLDAGKEEDQRYLIELYLSDGLDPQNPAHVMRLQNIDNDINNTFDRLENDSLAKSAKEYLLSKVNTEKAQIAQQKQAHADQVRENQQREHQAKQNWNNDFKNSLGDRNWSQDKKDNVISQFDIVQLDNGSEMEMWQYKFDAIWRDPKATQVFMDFMSDFDPSTLQFKRTGVPVSKQVTSTIRGIINNKTKSTRNTRHTSNRRTVTNKVTKIDPNNY